MEPQGRSKGRARGRARGAAATQPPQEQVTRRPGELAPPPGGLQHRLPQQVPQQPQQVSSGRATHRGTAMRDPVAAGDSSVGAISQRMKAMGVGDNGGNNNTTTSGNGAGNGSGNGTSVGRGAMRGRRQIGTDVVLRTKPATTVSKKGKSGNPLALQANYFKIVTKTDWCLYQYRVDFAPEEDSTVVRKALLRVHKDLFGGYLFDGTMIFCSRRLEKVFEVFSKRTSDDANIRITIKWVGEMMEGDFHYIQFFNIMMRRCLDHLKLQLVGRNYFDANAKVEVREFKLELWPGYMTSIRQHENDILMCAEVTHKVMRQDTVLDLLNECLQKSGNEYKRLFQESIIGTIVLTKYNNHTYRIDDVDFNCRPVSTFPLRSGEEISYASYYKSKYNLNIKNVYQPMLISRAKPRELRAGQSENIYLVPELCCLTGLNDEMRGNFHLMRALADHTRISPASRIQKLNHFSDRLRGTKEVIDDLTQWNMNLSNTLIDIPGRALPQEKILHGGQKSCFAGQDTDWTRSLRSNPMLLNGELKTWVMIFPARFARDIKSFVGTLQKAASGMSFDIPHPQYEEISDDRAGNYVEMLDRVISRFSPQMIFCVVSNNRSDRYSAIKKKCCVDRAVPTQVFVAKNMISKGVMSIATKVAIQLNCKIGGAPWSVEIPLTGLMIVGFDVCHDTQVKGKSFGAMVASLDKPFSRYFSAVSAHTNGEELSNDLAINLQKACMKYKTYNNALPARIIIYRDGVGEGQVSYVYTHEVLLVKEKLKELYGGSNLTEPKLGYIIVTKRINTRLFHNGNNPPPGTIVDDVITMPIRYDFYLVSQSVRQGSVSPTAYNVIEDNLGLDPDKLQRLSYKMTHLYFNWSGTVRVPAPCQYAHKLAFLVGQSIHKSPNSSLEDLLYFL